MRIMPMCSGPELADGLHPYAVGGKTALQAIKEAACARQSKNTRCLWRIPTLSGAGSFGGSM
jgi:hypothetical protein